MRQDSNSLLQASVIDVLDRNRNERQKAMLLIYAARLIRKQIAASRSAVRAADEVERFRSAQKSSRSQLTSSDANAVETAIDRRKMPVKSVRIAQSNLTRKQLAIAQA